MNPYIKKGKRIYQKSSVVQRLDPIHLENTSPTSHRMAQHFSFTDVIRWKRARASQRAVYNKRYNEVNGRRTALMPLSLCARALINRVRPRHHYPVKSLMIGRSLAGPWWLSLSPIRPVWRGKRENRASLFLSKLAWPNVIILNAMKAEGAQA